MRTMERAVPRRDGSTAREETRASRSGAGTGGRSKAERTLVTNGTRVGGSKKASASSSSSTCRSISPVSISKSTVPAAHTSLAWERASSSSHTSSGGRRYGRM